MADLLMFIFIFVVAWVGGLLMYQLLVMAAKGLFVLLLHRHDIAQGLQAIGEEVFGRRKP